MNKLRNFEFNFWDIIEMLWAHKKQLGLISLIAAILAAIVSSPLVIKPKYKSEVIFYPTTINSIANAMLTDLNKREADLLAFGEEEQAENALQLLNSSALQSRIARNFDLINHYKINKDGRTPQFILAKKMANNITFKRTRHLAVSIQVLDENPVKAAEIANGIASLYDSVKTEIQNQVAKEALVILQDQFKKKEEEVWDIRVRLKQLGDSGILNYEEQSRAIAEEIYKLGPNTPKGIALRKDQQELAKYAGEFTYLNETLILELENLSIARKRYERALVDVEKTLPQKFELTRGEVAEKKSYPIRWLIVLLSILTALFAGVLFYIFTDQLKDKETT